MLLPIIKIKTEIESNALTSIINNDWYYHIIEHEVFSNMRISNSSYINNIYISPRDSNNSHDNSHDFITNLCLGNIKKKYAIIFWKYLSFNCSAIELLIQNQHNIYFGNFVHNTHTDAIYLIEKNLRILSNDFHILSSNPSAINLLKKYPILINLQELMKNPNPLAVNMLITNKQLRVSSKRKVGGEQQSFGGIERNLYYDLFNGHILQNENFIKLLLNYLNLQNISKNQTVEEILSSKNEILINQLKNELNNKNINWFYLSLNPHPIAIQLLKLCPHKIHDKQIVMNSSPDAFDLISKIVKNHPQKVTILPLLSKNKNPRVLELLNEYPNYYNWANLSENPSAIPILIKPEHKMKIKVPFLLKNPNIFEYNYENMKKNIQVFKEELMQRVWCPTNVLKWVEQGYDDFLES